MHCLQHGADHGQCVIAKPSRAKGIGQLHALRMIACCRTDWNGDAALQHVSAGLFFSSRVVLLKFRAFGGGARRFEPLRRPRRTLHKNYLRALESITGAALFQTFEVTLLKPLAAAVRSSRSSCPPGGMASHMSPLQ